MEKLSHVSKEFMFARDASSVILKRFRQSQCTGGLCARVASGNIDTRFIDLEWTVESKNGFNANKGESKYPIPNLINPETFSNPKTFPQCKGSYSVTINDFIELSPANKVNEAVTEMTVFTNNSI